MTSRSGSVDRLVAMANDIANYFHSEPDRKLAIDGVVGHIMRFWEPRMRSKLVAYFTEHGGEGLSELAHAAVARLASPPQRA